MTEQERKAMNWKAGYTAAQFKPDEWHEGAAAAEAERHGGFPGDGYKLSNPYEPAPMLEAKTWLDKLLGPRCRCGQRIFPADQQAHFKVCVA